MVPKNRNLKAASAKQRSLLGCSWYTDRSLWQGSELRGSRTSGSSRTVNWKTSKNPGNTPLSLSYFSLFLSTLFPMHDISVTRVTDWQMTSHPFQVCWLWLGPPTSLKRFLNFPSSCSQLFSAPLTTVPYSLDRNSDCSSFDPVVNSQRQTCHVSSLLPRDIPCGHCEAVRPPKRSWPQLLYSWCFRCA